MEFTYGTDAERFRTEVRGWLDTHLTERFRSLGTGTEFHEHDWALRCEWEREMGAGNWIGLAWPTEFGGRGASVMEELVFAEEYARAGGPTRAGTFGEGLLGPTLIHFGTPEQKHRFLPAILAGEMFWCQGFSEPGAGSDLAGLSTRARLEGDQWVLDGQKVWTSQAHLSDWIFVLARTDAAAPKHKGISFLLVPLDQPGIEVRPLVDLTGSNHFCEVFFDGAVTEADLIVGEPGQGWAISMATLGFERGTAFMGQLKKYGSEYHRLVRVAQERGLTGTATVRQWLAQSYIGLELMRFGGFRTMTSVLRHGRPGPEASIGKLQWSQWHQDLGVLATEILGADALIEHDSGSDLHDIQHAFLFARSHSIYAGSSQVQRNIIGERVLGLPKEPTSGS
jgi:alkylation response protein AidB-like acyl-CoA dehydrogenase